MVRYCGSMQSWWRRVRYKVFSGGGRGEETNHVRRHDQAHGQTHDHAASASLTGAHHTSLCLSSGRFFQCHTRSEGFDELDFGWLLAGVGIGGVVDGYGYGAMQWR